MRADPHRLMAQFEAEIDAAQQQRLEDSRKPDPLETHAALMIVSGASEAINSASGNSKKVVAPHITLADVAMSDIDGQRDAQRLIYAVRQGCAPADALLEGLHQVQAFGDARLRGFARELQKTIEHFASRHGRD